MFHTSSVQTEKKTEFVVKRVLIIYHFKVEQRSREQSNIWNRVKFHGTFFMEQSEVPWNLFLLHLFHTILQSKFNPCTAESFVSIFQSFEAGIANAISSFK